MDKVPCGDGWADMTNVVMSFANYSSVGFVSGGS